MSCAFGFFRRRRRCRRHIKSSVCVTCVYSFEFSLISFRICNKVSSSLSFSSKLFHRFSWRPRPTDLFKCITLKKKKNESIVLTEVAFVSCECEKWAGRDQFDMMKIIIDQNGKKIMKITDKWNKYHRIERQLEITVKLKQTRIRFFSRVLLLLSIENTMS